MLVHPYSPPPYIKRNPFAHLALNGLVSLPNIATVQTMLTNQKRHTSADPAAGEAHSSVCFFAGS